MIFCIFIENFNTELCIMSLIVDDKIKSCDICCEQSYAAT